MTTPIRSSLGRHVATEPATIDGLRAIAQAAWHKPGPIEDVWVCTRLGDILAWDVREIFIAEAARQHGKRGK